MSLLKVLLSAMAVDQCLSARLPDVHHQLDSMLLRKSDLLLCSSSDRCRTGLGYLLRRATLSARAALTIRALVSRSLVLSEVCNPPKAGSTRKADKRLRSFEQISLRVSDETAFSYDLYLCLCSYWSRLESYAIISMHLSFLAKQLLIMPLCTRLTFAQLLVAHIFLKAT